MLYIKLNRAPAGRYGNGEAQLAEPAPSQQLPSHCILPSSDAPFLRQVWCAIGALDSSLTGRYGNDEKPSQQLSSQSIPPSVRWSVSAASRMRDWSASVLVYSRPQWAI